jgi:hypothetical protein
LRRLDHPFAVDAVDQAVSRGVTPPTVGEKRGGQQ